MKKSMFFVISGLAAILFAASCSKSNTTVTPVTYTVVGKWDTYISRPVGPAQNSSLNFKAGGSFAFDATSSSTTDLATGAWVLSPDSVRATYTYADGVTGTFSLAGKYSSDFHTMNGTIGTGSNTSGYGTFTSTK